MKIGKLKRLWKEDPHCHWCNKETFLPSVLADMATVDHVDDNWSTLEQRFSKSGETRKVLACNGCNKKRNNQRMKEIPKWMHQKRTALGQERKKLGDKSPRPSLFRILNLALNANK